MNPLELRNSFTKYVLLLIASMGFVAGGALIVWKGEAPLVGWTSILFFGAGVLVFAWQLVDARPRLVINEQGINDRTLGIGMIPWSEIAGAYVNSINNIDFICLVLRNPEEYRSRLSPVKRFMSPANRALGCTDFIINLAGINVPTPAIFELILKQARLAEDRLPGGPAPGSFQRALGDDGASRFLMRVEGNLAFGGNAPERVRVRRLPGPSREDREPADDRFHPRIGDIGVVIDVVDTPGDPDRFVVEFSDGGREWTATFEEDELEWL